MGKTIEDQGQKQIKAIEDNKKQPANTNGSDYKNELLISKKREIRILMRKILIK